MNLIDVIYSGGNAVPAWKEALKRCLELCADGVFFPGNEYHFYPEGTIEKYCFISNNDEGLKRIVFYLNGLRNFTLAGNHCKFIFHGRLSPVVAEHCENLTIQGITIDFATSFAEECEIVAVEDGMTEIRLAGGSTVEHGRLRFLDDPLDNHSGILRFCKYDSFLGQWAGDAGNICCRNMVPRHTSETVTLPLNVCAEPGDIFLLRHQERTNPGIVLDNCNRIQLDNIVLHHACGMGVVAQCSGNLYFRGISVISASERILSVTDDAIHISECSGRIVIENCILENTLDDAINIHGIYWKLRRRVLPSESTLFLEAGHFQQFGLNAGKPGDIFEFIHPQTMEAYAQCEMAELFPVTKQIQIIKFKKDLPAEFSGNDCVRNLSRVPDRVKIQNNRISNNRPRGILVSGVDRVRIEGNRIHSPGAGIYISGDSNFWFESGPIQHAVIRKNTFEHCNYVRNATGASPIVIMPEIPSCKTGVFYHGDILLEDNVFFGCSTPQVSAYSVRKMIAPDLSVTAHNCGGSISKES